MGTVSCDPHGNTTLSAPLRLSYDGADRRTSNLRVHDGELPSATSPDRIMSRTGGTATVRYGDAGGAPTFTTDSTNFVFSTSCGPAGGVSVTKRVCGDVWSYPSVHAEVVATADVLGASGAGSWPTNPFGTPLTAQGPANPDGVADMVRTGISGDIEMAMDIRRVACGFSRFRVSRIPTMV